MKLQEIFEQKKKKRNVWFWIFLILTVISVITGVIIVYRGWFFVTVGLGYVTDSIRKGKIRIAICVPGELFQISLGKLEQIVFLIKLDGRIDHLFLNFSREGQIIITERPQFIHSKEVKDEISLTVFEKGMSASEPGVLKDSLENKNEKTVFFALIKEKGKALIIESIFKEIKNNFRF